jgi:formimidoylglutamate deiminase
VGAALHSLRAVDVVSANEILPGVRSLFENCPLHIHVAEQIQEVLDCQAAHGQRPIDFLYDSLPVDETWSLIHATHLTTGEIGRIIDSKATICLCPTTEANLGDGFFAADKYTANNGRFCIGSDSHCSIDLREELRTLEYGQRLQRRERAILTAPNQSVGRYLYQLSAEGGGRAIGIKTGRIAIGYRADFTLVDPDHPAIAGSEGDALIDRLVFCNADDPIAGAVVGGVEYSLQVPDFLELVYDSQNEFNRLARRLSQ